MPEAKPSGAYSLPAASQTEGTQRLRVKSHFYSCSLVKVTDRDIWNDFHLKMPRVMKSTFPSCQLFFLVSFVAGLLFTSIVHQPTKETPWRGTKGGCRFVPPFPSSWQWSTLDQHGTCGTRDGHKRNERDPPADRNLSFPSSWQWSTLDQHDTYGASTKGEPQVYMADTDLSCHSLWQCSNLEGTFLLTEVRRHEGAQCRNTPQIHISVTTHLDRGQFGQGRRALLIQSIWGGEVFFSNAKLDPLERLNWKYTLHNTRTLLNKSRIFSGKQRKLRAKRQSGRESDRQRGERDREIEVIIYNRHTATCSMHFNTSGAPALRRRL